jgi:hypothetical protein
LYPQAPLAMTVFPLIGNRALKRRRGEPGETIAASTTNKRIKY